MKMLIIHDFVAIMLGIFNGYNRFNKKSVATCKVIIL